MTPKDFKDSFNKLTDIKQRTEKKKELEKEKNNVESYIYQMREKMSDDEDGNWTQYFPNDSVKSFTTEEQRESFIAILNEAEDWLYGEQAAASDYRAKL